ncbi:MAG: hypothetical protein ACRDUY_08255, partial [Nitriliruptorales bacterium]
PTAPPAAPPPDPQQGQQNFAAHLQVGSSPKGGQVRYVPTSVLPQQAFEQAIRNHITSLGFAEADFVVFDNRTGNYGLEDGKQAYSAATVKPRRETHVAATIGEKTSAFYVDFQQDGTLTVKASKKLEEYRQTPSAPAAQQQPPVF